MARAAPRDTLRSPFGAARCGVVAENLHAFRRESEARGGGGNSGKNPLLSRERRRYETASSSLSLIL